MHLMNMTAPAPSGGTRGVSRLDWEQQSLLTASHRSCQRRAGMMHWEKQSRLHGLWVSLRMMLFQATESSGKGERNPPVPSTQGGKYRGWHLCAGCNPFKSPQCAVLDALYGSFSYFSAFFPPLYSVLTALEHAHGRNLLWHLFKFP